MRRASRDIPPIFAPDHLCGELAKLSPPELADLIYCLADICISTGNGGNDEPEVLAQLRMVRGEVLRKRGHLATSLTMRGLKLTPNRELIS